MTTEQFTAREADANRDNPATTTIVSREREEAVLRCIVPACNGCGSHKADVLWREAAQQQLCGACWIVSEVAAGLCGGEIKDGAK